MQPQIIVNETIAFLLSSTDAAGEGAPIQFILALKRFPFDELCERFIKSATSTERAYTLHLLSHGAPHQVNTENLKLLASTVLYDKGAGLRRYGEARAYSSEGKRVCDVAYNILVSKGGLGATYPIVDVDNYSVTKRDQLIEKLGVDLKLPKPPSWNAPTQNLSEAVPPKLESTDSPIPQNATEAKPSLPSEEPTSSIFWSVVAVLIVAAIGLLWLLLKNRK